MDFKKLSLTDKLIVIRKLRLKYLKWGYVDPRVNEDAAALGLHTEDLIGWLISNEQPGTSTLPSPVAYCFNHAVLGLDAPSTYYLSDLPIMFFTKGRRQEDNLYNHPSKIRWVLMNSRCYRPQDHAYVNYGKRGIKVCDSWHRLNPSGRANYCHWHEKVLVEAISKDETLRGKKLDVDRIDNNGNYCPENCRVVPRNVNSQNTRKTILDVDKVAEARRMTRKVDKPLRTKFLKDLADKLEVEHSTLCYAVDGSHWKNVDSIEPPVELGGGVPGATRLATDEVVMSWRDRMRSVTRSDRVAELAAISREYGITENGARVYVVGSKAKHLNEVCPPVYTRKVIDNVLLNELLLEYQARSDAVSLNQFCIEKSKILGVSRGTIYSRLDRLFKNEKCLAP